MKDTPVIIEAKNIHNESSTPLNKKLITERLRNELNKAADGRMIFIAGNKEKESNFTPGYYFHGKITSIDSVDPESGGISHYLSFYFEIIDIKSGISVWGKKFEDKEFGQEDITNR